MYQVDRVRREIDSRIDRVLSPCGFFYRLFSRVKSEESAEKKILEKKYRENKKMLQDVIGTRIVLYFPEDVKCVVSILKNSFMIVNETVDIPSVNEFAPERINFVFRIPSDMESISRFGGNKFSGVIDNTFEIQIRTVFSEGWHEIEHDVRYKYNDFWDNNLDLSRTLNGVYASLISLEWTIEKILDDLAYKAYKNKKWSDMLRNKLRIRISGHNIDTKLDEILCDNESVAKEFLRIKKKTLFDEMNNIQFYFPLNINNVIYFYNLHFLKFHLIDEITPSVFRDEYRQSCSTGG